MIIVHVATFWMSLTMITSKKTKIVKYTVETKTSEPSFQTTDCKRSSLGRDVSRGIPLEKWRDACQKICGRGLNSQFEPWIFYVLAHALTVLGSIKDYSFVEQMVHFILWCRVHSIRIILEFSTLSGASPQILPPSPNFFREALPGGGCAFDPQIQAWLQGLKKLMKKVAPLLCWGLVL